MYSHAVKYRVCYADTDQMGYVYYGNYARLYEIARVETLRSLGVSYKSLEDNGIGLPVAEHYTKFIAPGLYDDELTVICQVDMLPTAKIVFSYRIKNEAGDLINEGKTTLVFMDLKTKKVIKAPDFIMNALMPYYSI
ncbi:acyl-CoA thioesterase [Aquirufa echingensis]|jgi:acyl-CoA thioester hydrolase|uniref:Thioesterase family protein n=1 Tax=Aquirufa echingensis TaxID=3096516 RepID=A0ABW6CY41_9BACT